METFRSTAQEAAEDLFFGQVVTVWARWFIIIAGAILMLWSAANIDQLTSATLLIVPLMAINFFVHGRYLMERPANQSLLFGLGLVDIIIITILVLSNIQGGSGLESEVYVFYYPVILAFAFVFPPKITVVFTLIAVLAYSGASVLGGMDLAETSLIKSLVQRLIIMAAMGGLATYYWRIQRQRRRGV